MHQYRQDILSYLCTDKKYNGVGDISIFLKIPVAYVYLITYEFEYYGIIDVEIQPGKRGKFKKCVKIKENIKNSFPDEMLQKIKVIQ
jgi:predicted transcriptional regulator